MKKTLLIISLISCITISFAGCSNKDKNEIKRYTEDDFPSNRILQTTCPVISNERTGEHDPKYVYKIKCDNQKTNFEATAYDNYYFKPETMVTFTYVKEKEEILVLDMSLYEENTAIPYSDLHPEFQQTNSVQEESETEINTEE